MRPIRIFLVFLFIHLFIPVSAQKPLIFCEKSTYDFGTIKEVDGKVSHVFIIKNMGKAPLVISDAKASCGCTTPEWTKKPILPGKSASIKVTFNPKNRPGVFSKTVEVYSNALKKSFILIIRGNVIGKD